MIGLLAFKIQTYAIAFFLIKKKECTCIALISLRFFLRSIDRSCSTKNLFLKFSQNSQENTCAVVSFLIKKTLSQVFSCEFSEIFKNTFFTEHLLVTVSLFHNILKANNRLFLLQLFVNIVQTLLG